MKLLDVTLREGEQRPGVQYSVAQKIEAARELDSLGVDYIQIGFPVADGRTAEVCDRINLTASTTGIARAVPGDVKAAIEASVDIVDLFAPTSDHQLEHILGKDHTELFEIVVEAADIAHDHGIEVHFSAMDGFRTEPSVLDDLFATVDAELYTIADTIGSRTPAGVVNHLEALETKLSCVGVHFHDDLGVGTANAIAAARLGVEKVDVSVAGLGERAGNVALEEFVVAAAVGDESCDVAVDQENLLPIAHRVLDTLDETVVPEKALLGTEVFSHESGLHTAAMLDEPSTFEPFDPAQFGGRRQLLFGSDTGRGAARRILERIERKPTGERVDRLLERLTKNSHEFTLVEATAVAEEID